MLESGNIDHPDTRTRAIGNSFYLMSQNGRYGMEGPDHMSQQLEIVVAQGREIHSIG